LSGPATQSLRVCMVVRALPIHRLGGLEYHTLDLANGLAARGHEVHLITSAVPARPNPQALRASVRLHHLPGTRPGDYTVAFFRSVEREVLRLHAEHRFDLVHTQDFAGLLVGKLPVPFVTTIHGTLTSETPLDRRYMRHLTLAGKLRALWRYKHRIAFWPFYRAMLLRPEALIVDSDYTRRELLLQQPQLRERIHLVPLGLDNGRYPKSEAGVHEQDARATVGCAAPGTGQTNAVCIPAETSRPLRIALLGRLQEIKGLRIAVEAAEMLRLRGVPFEMRIAGGGEYESPLRRMIAERRLEGCVHLLGRIADSDLPEFLSTSDVFLFPDLTQPAFGLVALEAMHYGLPVVAARSGAIPEVVEDTCGWLYDPWDVQGLAALLSPVSAHRHALAGKSAAGRERAATFTSAAMAERVEAVYRNILIPV